MKNFLVFALLISIQLFSCDNGEDENNVHIENFKNVTIEVFYTIPEFDYDSAFKPYVLALETSKTTDTLQFFGDSLFTLKKMFFGWEKYDNFFLIEETDGKLKSGRILLNASHERWTPGGGDDGYSMNLRFYIDLFNVPVVSYKPLTYLILYKDYNKYIKTIGLYYIDDKKPGYTQIDSSITIYPNEKAYIKIIFK